MFTIYFDNAASTVVSGEVLTSFSEFVNKYYANASSAHNFGMETAKYESYAREQILNLLKVTKSNVIFTSGATEANNLAIKGSALFYKNRGKHLITSNIEHASVLEAFKQLENEFGFEVTYLEVNEKGVITVEQVLEAIRDDTILVSIMLVNNEIGSINDINEIGRALKKYPKVLFHSDITQGVGKIPFDLTYVDMASMSLHKIQGLKGSGILVKKENISFVPLLSGGGQENGLRSGTNNVPLEVAAAKTLRLALDAQEEAYKNALQLKKALIQGLKEIKGIKINSQNGSPFIVNFSLPCKASVVVEALSLKEIYVSTKSACSSKKNTTSYVLKAIGCNEYEASNSIRVSFYKNQTKEEVLYFIDVLKDILNKIYKQ